MPLRWVGIIEETIKLVSGDALRVNGFPFNARVLLRFFLDTLLLLFGIKDVEGVTQNLPGSCLTRHGATNKHVTMAGDLVLMQLEYLDDQILIELKVSLAERVFNGEKQVIVSSVGLITPWKQINKEVVE